MISAFGRWKWENQESEINLDDMEHLRLACDTQDANCKNKPNKAFSWSSHLDQVEERRPGIKKQFNELSNLEVKKQ